MEYIIQQRSDTPPFRVEYRKPHYFGGSDVITFKSDAEASAYCRELNKGHRPGNEAFRVILLQPNPAPKLTAQVGKYIALAPEERLLRIEREGAKLHAAGARLAAIRNYTLSCTEAVCTTCNFGKGCGKVSLIRDLVYIQTHWYVPPSGCTEGDYWRSGDGEYDCPHCGLRNRLYNRPYLIELKRLFHSVTETYDHR